MDKVFKLLIKDYQNVNDKKVRDSYGRVSGIVGIASNLVLTVMKVLTGLLSGSIAIVADGINNMADALSSVVTLIGFKLAALPEDNEHPYGHARIEYISGMIVSMIIIIVGFELGKSSFTKILHPEELDFSIVTVIILAVSIIIKVLQAAFNKSAGKKINSLTLIATGEDSRNDVIATSAVLISTIVGHIFDINIDGIMGLLVAVFIIYSGITLTKETISPLLGEAPSDELVREIEKRALSYPGVLGIHDLVVHSYGPGKTFASIHIEVDSRGNLMDSHELMDKIEVDLRHDLDIFLTCHMDPIDITNPDRDRLKELISREIQNLDGVLNFHDLRIVPGKESTNVIFDLLLSTTCKIDHSEIKSLLETKIREYNPTFNTVITFDTSYVSDAVFGKEG